MIIVEDLNGRILELTRADGTTVRRPRPADYPTAVSYVRAFYDWKDEIADAANRAFDEAFRREMAR